jgi:hypothetical protein
VISTTEYKRVFDWYEVLQFEQASIAPLVEYCVAKKGKRVSFNYIDTVMMDLAQKGVTSAEDVERWILTQEAVNSGAARVLSRWSLRRAPTVDEMMLYRKWTEEWGFAEDAVIAACRELTATDKPNFKYLDAVMESFHTEGFYKRESSLFAQLVPQARRRVVSADDYARQPPEHRLERLARTPAEVAALIAGRTGRSLARRPAPHAWAPAEVVGHLRDAEELFMMRLETVLAMREPRLIEMGPPDRWAEERQYLRHDPAGALAAFRRRRDESLTLLRALPAIDWQRGGLHPVRGRLSIDDLVAIMAWHDDNHLDQLARALEGKA